jgi:hypothetical protein
MPFSLIFEKRIEETPKWLPLVTSIGSVEEINKKLGVVIIQRSLHKPHEITRKSGTVTPGIYIKRGSETFQARREDILSMTGMKNNYTIIVNFTHPITPEQINQISKKTELNISEIVQPPKIPIHFDENH